MTTSTIHTVCSKRNSETVCVELFLNEAMELQDISKPYSPGKAANIRLDGTVSQEVVNEPTRKSGCSSCEEATKARKANLLGRLAKGVPGLLKSELGIDRAGPSLMAERRSICLDCPSDYYDFGVCNEERGGCGCFLASKITIKGEACPEGHW
tara:strand:+ start:945 stop:1403 length:459 start_codon:yes stop_codon:yes gene_type:complete